jgi:hypothetical protein
MTSFKWEYVLYEYTAFENSIFYHFLYLNYFSV